MSNTPDFQPSSQAPCVIQPESAASSHNDERLALLLFCSGAEASGNTSSHWLQILNRDLVQETLRSLPVTFPKILGFFDNDQLAVVGIDSGAHTDALRLWIFNCRTQTLAETATLEVDHRITSIRAIPGSSTALLILDGGPREKNASTYVLADPDGLLTLPLEPRPSTTCYWDGGLQQYVEQPVRGSSSRGLRTIDRQGNIASSQESPFEIGAYDTVKSSQMGNVLLQAQRIDSGEKQLSATMLSNSTLLKFPTSLGQDIAVSNIGKHVAVRSDSFVDIYNSNSLKLVSRICCTDYENYFILREAPLSVVFVDGPFEPHQRKATVAS